MSFTSLQLRYQTARSLPAPYAYFSTLTMRPVGREELQVELSVTYPDREDIDDDELIAEGFTRNDDVHWSGKLPDAWYKAISTLIAQTQLHPASDDDFEEDDDFWQISVDATEKKVKSGVPNNPDAWHYVEQELLQASYEASGKERPFTLTFLEVDPRRGDAELTLSASFLERTVRVHAREGGRERTHTHSWDTLHTLMSQVYEHDFTTDEILTQRPKRTGQWLSLGTDEWYNVGQLPGLVKYLFSLG